MNDAVDVKCTDDEWSDWGERHGRQSREGSGRALREAAEIQPTTAKNLEEKFDRGEDVVDYFDVRKARVVGPQSKESASQAKFKYQVRTSNRRAAAVHENRGKGFPR